MARLVPPFFSFAPLWFYMASLIMGVYVELFNGHEATSFFFFFTKQELAYILSIIVFRQGGKGSDVSFAFVRVDSVC